mmetsp:Transcript_11154/g.33447  ORF Transcript_11154/g.33447 Transcript_11154/m.33447 type:complete len:95 (+) Transcript_11154:1513-1797(+)
MPAKVCTTGPQQHTTPLKAQLDLQSLPPLQPSTANMLEHMRRLHRTVVMDMARQSIDTWVTTFATRTGIGTPVRRQLMGVNLASTSPWHPNLPI